MIIALLSDVHANLPALEAAVEDARRRGADEVLCAGDAVGYGPFPSGVCAFLRRNGIESIAGNYDRKALEAVDRPAEVEAAMKPGKWRILDWTRSNLDSGAERFLRGLPDRISRKLPGGIELLVVHGSPLSDEDTVYPSVTAAGLAPKLGGARPGILACGHTHIPFARRVGGILVANCGSAGMPVDGDPRPSYALVEIRRGRSPSCRVVRFSYPMDRLAEAFAATSLPGSLRRDFSEGNKSSHPA